MKLSLIGMSGSGKSYWSTKLVEQEFKRFCCDDLIEAKLEQELIRPDGTMLEVGEWMGFPYQPDYRRRAEKYLAYEIEVMNEICAYLKSTDEDVVVDTTGSAIYTGERVMQKLRQQTVMVHLSTPPEVQAQMLRKYLVHQRPVLWNGLFRQKPNETNEAALTRCYPKLLSSREQLYRQYADVVIDYDTRHQEGFTEDTFLELIRANQGNASRV